MEAGVARRYATALYDIASRRNVLPQVTADVEILDRTFREEPRLRSVLDNPEVPDERKKAIFQDLFGQRVQPLTIQFCQLLVDKRRVDVLEYLHEEFQQLADKASGIVRARVQTAIPMTPDQEARMMEQLQKLTGKKVILSSSVDPSLQGGAVVWIGDRVIDGSIKGYLQSLERQLAQ